MKQLINSSLLTIFLTNQWSWLDHHHCKHQLLHHFPIIYSHCYLDILFHAMIKIHPDRYLCVRVWLDVYFAILDLEVHLIQWSYLNYFVLLGGICVYDFFLDQLVVRAVNVSVKFTVSGFSCRQQWTRVSVRTYRVVNGFLLPLWRKQRAHFYYSVIFYF